MLRCADRPGRNPYETVQKVLSRTPASSTMTHRPLKHLVLKRRYPQRPGLGGRAGLGDVHSTHRRRLRTCRTWRGREGLEVGLQVDLVFRRRLSVHADGPVRACPSIGCEHPFHVDVMGQGRERHLTALAWRVPRSVVVSWTRTRVSAYPPCFPPTVHKTASPSLPRVPRVVPLAQRYYETLRLLAAHLAALRFLRLAIPSFVPCSSPPARDRAVDQPGVGKPVLQPAVTMETAGSPKFPGNPIDHSPCSPTPV